MTRKSSMSLMEFTSRFPDEQACRDYLQKQRWPRGFCCPNCQHHRCYTIRTRNLFECCECGRQTSLTAGTIMHKSKLPLRAWFWAIYLVACDKRGRSALAISQLLSINYRSAWRMLHKIRRAMGTGDARRQLVGLVELDETYLSVPRRRNGPKMMKKTPIAVCLQTDEQERPQYLQIRILKSLSTDDIYQAVRKVIAKGSTLITDSLNAHIRLGDKGYKLESEAFFLADKETFLKWTHMMISNLKAYILGTYHGLTLRYLQTYLNEFCYRFNRRFNPNKLFDHLLNDCLSTYPGPYPEQNA